MNIPEWDIRVDWHGTGDFDAPGSDITDRVFNRGTPVTWSYGRDQARTFAPMSGSNGQFEIDNSSRDYSPENPTSPLAGLILAGRDVRIRATYNDTEYGMLFGYLEDYKVQPDLDQQSLLVTLADALTKLRGIRVTTELYGGIRTGQAINHLLDAAGWPEDLRTIDPGATILPWWWVEDQDAGTALQQIVDSEGPGAQVHVDISGRIVFWDRHHPLLDTFATTVQATLRSSGSEPCFSDIVYNHGWKEIVNAVSFTVPVRHPSGQLESVWSMRGPRPISDGETVELSAQASNPFLGAVVPEAGVDFELISGAVQVSLSRTSGQSTTVLVKAVGGPAVVADMSVRAYQLETQTTVQVRAEDTASIMSPIGRRSWPSGRDPVLAGVPDAIAIADLILGQRARRLPTVHITLRGGVHERLEQQLYLWMADRVRIVDSLTGLDADFRVVRMEYTVNDDLVTKLACEQIPTPVEGVFTFNDAALGFDDGKFGGTGIDDPSRIFIFDDATQGRFDVGLFAT